MNTQKAWPQSIFRPFQYEADWYMKSRWTSFSSRASLFTQRLQNIDFFIAFKLCLYRANIRWHFVTVNNNTFSNASFTIVWTLIHTNMKQHERLHYGIYWLQALQVHLFSKYQSFMRVLNWFAFLDNFISLGREFQIFGPKKLIDLIP